MYNIIRGIQNLYICKVILVRVAIIALIVGVLSLGMALFSEAYDVFAGLAVLYMYVAIFYRVFIKALNKAIQEDIEKLKCNCKEVVPCKAVQYITNCSDNSVIFLQHPNKNGTTTRIIRINSKNEIYTWNMTNDDFQKVFKTEN